MAGEKVIVRAYGGAAYVRKLLSVNGRAAMICPVESYDAIVSGEDDAPLVGFPVEDVFKYDDIAASTIALGGEVQWEKLRPIA